MAASSPLRRAAVVALLATCAVIGGYGTLGVGLQNGFFDTITNSIAVPIATGRTPHMPGCPAPFKSSYTGIKGVDAQLAGLVAFFCVSIDGAQSRAITLS